MWLSLYNKTYFVNITEATTISCDCHSEEEYTYSDKKTIFYLTVKIKKGVDSIITFYFEDTEDGQINRNNFLETIYNALKFNFNMLRIDYKKYGIVKIQ